MKKTFYLLLTVSLVWLTSHGQTLSNLSQMEFKASYRNDKEIQKAVTAPTGGDATREKSNWLAAAQYAQEQKDAQGQKSGLAKYLSAFKSGIITPSFNPPGDDELRNASYVSLAMKPQKDIDKYFKDNSISGDDQKTIQYYIGNILKDVQHLTPPTIAVFASGDIAGSIGNSGGSGAQNTIASGSVGIQYINSSDIFSARISVASTIDTLKSNFGASLLSPAKGKPIGSGILEWYHRLNWTCMGDPWLHLYASAASATWGVDTSSANPLYRSASVTGIGALLNWSLFKGKIASTDVGLNIEAGLSGRLIGGDVRSMFKKGGSDSTSYLKIFPSSKGLFIGPEFGLNIHVGDVTAALQGYIYNKGSKVSVDGLTGLQFSFGISINASVISGILE